MNPEQVRKMLEQTLDDRRLTRSERKAMDRIFDHIDPDAHALALYRSVAFDLARQSIVDPTAIDTIEWLEEVVKMLQSADASDGPPATADTYFAPGDDCPARIRGLLARARNTVDICVFTITDDRVSDAIIDAHERRLKVRVISDDDKSGDRGSDIQRLESAGVEVRVPLVAPALVDFAMGLTLSERIDLRRTKKILRDSQARRLPPAVLARPKQGFGVPLRAWLHGPARPLLDELTAADVVERRGLFDAAAVARLREAFHGQRIDAALTLFPLMAIELWGRALDAAPTADPP